MPDKICQKIIANMNTNMSIGRLNAQCAHASWISVLDLGYWDGDNFIISCSNNPELKEWLSGNFTKVVLKSWSNESLIELRDKAVKAGLPVGLMNEDGFNTALAIGPANIKDIDKITKGLNLL